LTGSTRARDAAEQLMLEARDLRAAGDLTSAVSRLREAVRLDPDRVEAFAELGGLLYRLGEHDHALGAYDIVLRRQPKSRAALLGSAAVLSNRRSYASAAERLRTLLRYHPTDAEAWMSLGDVAVYQGDEALARECYTRATQIDPSAGEVIAAARERLALMNRVSRTYRSGG
jgi:cytochrome c-type biogenesis protein CcmH/NrfG